MIENEKNIVLIGMRGSGKSTVGRRVAEELHMQHIEMDDEVVKKAGRTIPEIVKQDGWNAFRDLESDVAREVGQSSHAVISTGGGAILREENVIAFKKNGRLVYLETPVEKSAERIGGEDPNRPRLTEQQSFMEELEEILEERESTYRRVADYTINTADLTENEVASKILELLKGKLK